MDIREKDYVAIVQCDIVMERCSGFGCEAAFHQRAGGFADLPEDRPVRVLMLTCGGCCGLGVQRKLSDLIKCLKGREGIQKDRIVVQLATCITKDSYHGPPCPHLDYLREVIGKLGLDVRDDTYISKKAQERRESGEYAS